MSITGYKIETIFSSLLENTGGWQLGRPANRNHGIKSKDVLFCGRVTPLVIGKAISEGVKIIVAVDPLEIIPGEFIETLYKNGLYVFSLGSNWEIENSMGTEFLSYILNISHYNLHRKDKKSLFFSSEKPKLIIDILLRVAEGAIIWGVNDLESLQTTFIENLSFSPKNVEAIENEDLVITNLITEDIIRRVKANGGLLVWIQRSVLTSEIAREVIRYYTKEVMKPGILVLEPANQGIILSRS